MNKPPSRTANNQKLSDSVRQLVRQVFIKDNISWLKKKFFFLLSIGYTQILKAVTIHFILNSNLIITSVNVYSYFQLYGDTKITFH